jgi:DNA anti-recombination protein RmuC
MKAIGIRNIVEGEKETRRRKQRELQALVDEKAAELSRMNSELDSLSRIQEEQQELISRLVNNEGTGLQ